MKRPDFKYYVIQFLELPYKDIDEYVCIPWSWIRLQRPTDRKVVVSYPVEDPSDTEKRVKRRQRFSAEWRKYMSVVEYSTDVYEDALIFIKEKIYEDKCSKITHGEQKSSKTSEKKSHKHKSSHKMESMGTPQEYIRLSNNEDTSAIKITLKRKPSTNPAEEVGEQKREASVNKDIPTQKSSTQEKSNSPETSTQSASVNKDPPVQEYPKRSEQENLTDFLMLLTKLHVSFADMRSLFDKLREAFIHNAETMVNLVKTIENFRSLSDNAPADVPLNTTTEGRRESEQIDDGNVCDDDCDDDESDHKIDEDFKETPKKRIRRRIVLPPEYNRQDSRWTLKYREPAPELVELKPQTEIYINAENFKSIKAMSNDAPTLARMLLLEIFTTKALHVCSLTGAKPNNYDERMKNYVRPGLDEHARTVLLKFVEEYAREKGWKKVDNRTIVVSLRNKMIKMRLQRRR